jgi:linoleoyl-CoA desaturase
MKVKVKFTNKDKTQFFNVLKQRVDNYFIENNISQHANAHMVFKTIFMITLYFVPYALIITEIATGWAFWLCWGVVGLGLAGIGMSVMHDANHGAYSSSNFVNRFVGTILNIVGGDSNNWKVQHNHLHHTFTNIQGHDEDVNDKVGMRFSPNGKYNKAQKFQVFYVFFFYSLMTLYWTTAKDYDQFYRYGKAGHDRSKGWGRFKNFFTIFFWKMFYLAYIIGIPVFVVGIVWWKVLLGFLVLHAVAGLILSIVFQLAHVVENTIFPTPDENGNIETEWAIHQLQTTADFAKDNWLVTFYVGGLNYQAIHHLFPRICHVHYPAIAPIVAETAKEFGVPYIYNESFTSAFLSHVRFIRQLGRDEIKPLVIWNNMG